jgi:hypothetical protein
MSPIPSGHAISHLNRTKSLQQASLDTSKGKRQTGNLKFCFSRPSGSTPHPRV